MCVTVYGVISWHRVRASEREESGGDCKQAGLWSSILFFLKKNTSICSTSVYLRRIFFYRFLLFLRSWNMQKKGFYVFIST